MRQKPTDQPTKVDVQTTKQINLPTQYTSVIESNAVGRATGQIRLLQTNSRQLDHRSSTLLASMLLLVGLISGITLFFLAKQPVLAENMQSNSYVIQFGNFNVTAGEKSGPNYSVTDTVGQTGVGPYGSFGVTNYFIGSGFQYIYQIPEFEFSISTTAIDFGELIMNTHASQSHTMSITTRGAGGYVVYTIAQSPLRHQNGSAEIPFTSCDASDCTTSVATIWTNQNIPGFGYNMTGDDVPSDFVNFSYFRPFPDRELAESPQPVMQSNDIADNATATINYKAGVTGNQTAGRYSTGISFIAVPGY